MPIFNSNFTIRVEKVVRYYLTRNTRTIHRNIKAIINKNNCKGKGNGYTIKNATNIYNIIETIVKKYIRLIYRGKPFATNIDAYRPPTLTDNKDKAFNIVIQIANRSHFPLNNASLIKLANQLRTQRLSLPLMQLHKN